MIVMGNEWMSGDRRRKRKIEGFIFKWSVKMEPHYLTLCGLKILQDGCVRCRRWRRSGACGCNNLWSRKEPCFFGRVKIYLHHQYESPHLMTRKRVVYPLRVDLL